MRKQSDKWDRFYLSLAQFVSQLSKDSSTKVGAVVVNWEHGLEFFGYNGFPPGMVDYEHRYQDREFKINHVVHAEENALYKATRVYAKNASLYLTLPPCSKCCLIALSHGIKEVVMYKPTDLEFLKRWETSLIRSRMICEETGVTWREIEEGDLNET